jgi:hypothetical protein
MIIFYDISSIKYVWRGFDQFLPYFYSRSSYVPGSGVFRVCVGDISPTSNHDDFMDYM